MAAITAAIIGAATLAYSGYQAKRARDRTKAAEKEQRRAEASLAAKAQQDSLERARIMARQRQRSMGLGSERGKSTVLTSPLGLMGVPVPAGQKKLLGS
jgi:hypothetical protein